MDNNDRPIDGASPRLWTRGELLRDVIVFQFKLLLDGTRDLVLSPISIFVGILGVISSQPAAGRQFYELLRWGHKTDRWIGLFTAADGKFGSSEEGKPGESSADAIVNRLEDIVKGKLMHEHKRSIEKDGPTE